MYRWKIDARPRSTSTGSLANDVGWREVNILADTEDEAKSEAKRILMPLNRSYEWHLIIKKITPVPVTEAPPESAPRLQADAMTVVARKALDDMAGPILRNNVGPVAAADTIDSWSQHIGNMIERNYTGYIVGRRGE